MNKFDTILILAGGKSSRFWPLNEKNLFIFQGTTLLEKQLNFYSSYSDNLVVVGNHDNKAEVEKIAKSAGALVAVQERSGQASAILSAKDLLHGTTLIVNGADTNEQSLIDKVLAKISESDCDAVVTSRKVKSYFPGGYYQMNGAQVVDVIEKPGADNMPSVNFRMVCEAYRDIADFVSIIESTHTDTDDHFERSLSAFLASERKIELINYQGRFAALKYPWHALSMMNFYLKGTKSYIGKNVEIDPTARIVGAVHIEDGVKIFEYSKIVGPCYIGKNVIIGNFSLVLQSMIEEHSVVGGYTEVTRSYLGKNVWLHRNYIGDSVIDRDVLFGAGALTANYRLDRQTIRSAIKSENIDSGLAKLGAIVGAGARIGVNCSLMPGVKIAPQSKVLPGTEIQEDIV